MVDQLGTLGFELLGYRIDGILGGQAEIVVLLLHKLLRSFGPLPSDTRAPLRLRRVKAYRISGPIGISTSAFGVWIWMQGEMLVRAATR